MAIKTPMKKKAEEGFALLMTIIVVGVVLSVGLSILDLTIKQVRLSTNAKESEVAFHAANAGMECARYWRRTSAQEMETGQPIDPECFSTTADNNVHTEITAGVTGDGQVFEYEYEFTWGGPAEPRCTQIDTLVASSSAEGSGVTIENMETLIAGYPDGDTKVCEPGSRCTVITVKGYNRPCNTVAGYGVVQREVLLQF